MSASHPMRGLPFVWIGPVYDDVLRYEGRGRYVQIGKRRADERPWPAGTTDADVHAWRDNIWGEGSLARQMERSAAHQAEVNARIERRITAWLATNSRAAQLRAARAGEQS